MKKLVFAALLFFILTIPIEDMLSVNKDLSMTRMIGQVVIGAWILVILLTQKMRRIHPFFIFVLLFVAWNILSVFWTIDSDLTELRAKTYVQLGIMSLMIWDLVEGKDQLRAVLQTFIIGAYISVGGTILNFISGTEAYLYSGGRYVATGFNANDLAILLALGVPIAWYMVLSCRTHPIFKWFTLINMLYVPLSLFAVILTGSRAGFLVALLSLVFIAFTTRHIGKWGRASFVILLGVMILITAVFVPEGTLNRVLSTFSAEASDDLGGRLTIYAAAARSIDAHPLLGIGCGAFKSATGLNIIAHNSFLSVLSETGIIGFLFFAVILIICFVEAFRQPKLEAFLWISILLMWGLGGSSVSWDFRKPTWLLLTLIIISAELFGEKSKNKQTLTSSSAIVHLGLPDNGVQELTDPLVKP